MTSPYGTGTVTPFALSGNPTIDAFTNIGIKWGSGGQGVGAVVTYSFPKAGAAWISDYYDGEPFDGFQGFNAAQQNAARQALSLWSEVADIQFVEVPDTANDVGDIRFGFSRVVTNSTAAAWAYYPYENPNYEFPEAGDIWFDAKYPPNLQMTPGKFGFSTLLHEIGHAIGLDHPFNDGFGEPVLDSALDNLRYTVMSYTPVAFVSVEPMTPMLLDILAIQHIYGANMTTRTGNDVYKFSASVQELRAIWDAGGIDTIDASNQTVAAIINLDDGEFSSIGRRVYGVAADNIAIAYGVTIENAKGGSGADKITGNDVANVLSGNAGNDILDGELGADTLRGGRGNDIYIIGDGDTIDEQGNRDLGDEIRISTSVNLTAFAGGVIERATAIGDNAVNFTGNKAANILIGNAATNILDGAAGADILKGGAGNDLYYVDVATDRIDEGTNKDAADEVRSTVAVNLTTLGKGQIEIATLLGTKSVGVTGNTQNNFITGNSGANILNGGGGNDTLKGAEGNDTLTDTLGSNDLDGGIGNDRLTTSAGHDTLIGAQGNDTLSSGAGNDVLDGGAGIDSMNGGTGADTYYVDDAKDKVIDSGTNDVNDRVIASIAIDLNAFAGGLLEHVTLTGADPLTATGNSRDNVILGNDGANQLAGGLGNDLLSGGLGADKLLGGAGNDNYVIDEAGDIIDEQFNNDTDDKVLSSITVDLAVLGGGAIEHLELYGTESVDALGNAAHNTITGNDSANLLDGRVGNDALAGKGGNDTLLGGSGNDSLDGGGGIDVMKGGIGNDSYFIDSALDVVDEEDNGDNADQVYSTISLDLATFAGGAIENVVLLPNWNLIDAFGNAAGNLIVGNAGMNNLDGRSGADTMRGGAGRDFYVVDDLGDVIEEEGSDSDDVSSSEISLDLRVLGGGSVENARLFGNASLSVTGSASDNQLAGNSGSNIIDGGAGNDYLSGGGGNDTLIGGGGNDSALGVDGDDTIILPAFVWGYIDGGSGTDTLLFSGAGLTIEDLNVNNIEIIDITGTGTNTLVLERNVIEFMSTTSNHVIIDGDAGDKVVLTHDFVPAADQIISGKLYHAYDSSGASAYVADGVAVVHPPISTIRLVDIDSENGLQISGSSASARSGYSISSAGDVNNDGYDDLLIGAPAIGDWSFPAGSSYLIFGSSKKDDLAIDLGKLSSDDGAKISGGESGDRFGSSVARIGDINGDGIDDFLIGSPYAGIEGAAYVIYGRSDGFPFPAATSELNGTNGFRVEGTTYDANLGHEVSAAGDLNGDGLDDLVVGAPYSDANGFDAGATYIIFGSTSNASAVINVSTLNGLNGTRVEGQSVGALSGASVALIGDMNGDGIDDLLIGANRADTSIPNSGGAFVVFGTKTGFDPTLDLADLNGKNGFALVGRLNTSLTGESVASAGDFNGDGYSDIVIGAPLDSSDGKYGSAFVTFGHGGFFAASTSLAELNTKSGFQITGIPFEDRLGWEVASAGDVNADGFDDLLVASEAYRMGGTAIAYLIYGHGGTVQPILDLSQLTAQSGVRIELGYPGATYPSDAPALAGAGDLNGDGFDDLTIADPNAIGNGQLAAGNTMIIYGSDFRDEITHFGTFDDDVLSGTLSADKMTGAQGNDIVNGNGGADAINGGQGNDEIHVADNKFFRIDGGTGVDTLHLDYAGAIDFGNLDGNVSTSDRNRIQNVEALDVDNGHANAITLHLADVLDLDATISDVGGVASLDNVLRIDGNAGDTLQMFNVDGWGAADTSSLTGYAVYSYQAVKVAIDLDIAVSMT